MIDEPRGDCFVVQGGRPLGGTLVPAGNKNEALPVLAAALLAPGAHRIENLPRIRDVGTLLEILTGLGVGVISMVDNVLRPMLLSGRAHMNGLIIFVSLLGGLSVFGLLGSVLGPILVVTALALLTIYLDIASPEQRGT